MEVRYGMDANMAYIREALVERLTDPKRDRGRDVSLVLKALAFLVDGANSTRRGESTDKEREHSQERFHHERGTETRFSDYPREYEDYDPRAFDEEPYVINFERAKAEILARRRQENAYRASEQRREFEERPRLKIFRAE